MRFPLCNSFYSYDDGYTGKVAYSINNLTFRKFEEIRKCFGNIWKGVCYFGLEEEFSYGVLFEMKRNELSENLISGKFSPDHFFVVGSDEILVGEKPKDFIFLFRFNDWKHTIV